MTVLEKLGKTCKNEFKKKCYTSFRPYSRSTPLPSCGCSSTPASPDSQEMEAHRREVARLMGENSRLQREVFRLTQENDELRAGGERPERERRPPIPPHRQNPPKTDQDNDSGLVPISDDEIEDLEEDKTK